MQMFFRKREEVEGAAALTYTHAYVYTIAKMQGIYYFITLLSISVSDSSDTPTPCILDPHFPRPLVLSHVPSAHAMQ